VDRRLIEAGDVFHAAAIGTGRALCPANVWLRWAVWSASIVALVAAIAASTLQLHIDRDCKGGAFSGGFSSGFDTRRCGITVEHIPTGSKITIPLPRDWL
jgi:hypothetical protein